MLDTKDVDMLREEFSNLLAKPHVTWDKKGMLYQLQMAMTNVALKRIEMEEDPESRFKRIEETLTTLVGWIAQSAAGIISVSDAERLFKMLKGK